MAARGEPAQAQAALVDRGYLARLARHLGRPAVDEILEDGMLELLDRRARLERAHGGGSAEAIAALAHDLVALAGHLGLGRLSAAAVMLERRARGGDDSAARAAAGAVLSLIDGSVDALAGAREGLP